MNTWQNYHDALPHDDDGPAPGASDDVEGSWLAAVAEVTLKTLIPPHFSSGFVAARSGHTRRRLLPPPPGMMEADDSARRAISRISISLDAGR